MARGLNGSANGAGHGPTGREGVEARLPGVSNLPSPVVRRLSAVVGLRTTIPKDRRSAQTLGAEREGHGVLIGDDGLIVTIGYLIMEADTVTVTDIDGNELPAYIVGYDYESGFGLVRTERPVGLKPMSVRRFRQRWSCAARPMSRASAARRRRSRSRSPAGASSPATGNICSTTRSSRCLPIRCGAARP